MEIGGLPAHVLVLHAAVVLGPLGALAGLAYAVLPGRRRTLRLPMLVLVWVATLAVVAAYLTGRSFLGSRPDLAQIPLVRTHRTRGTWLLVVSLAWVVVASAAGLTAGRGPGVLRPVLTVLLGAGSAAVLVLVVLTGDAGAHAVWG